MPTPIGQRNNLVTIQRSTSAADGQGGQTVLWGALGTAWAAFEPLSYRESVMAAQMTSALVQAATIPFRDDISVKDRLVIGTRTLEILSIQDITGLRRELKLLCAEVQA